MGIEAKSVERKKPTKLFLFYALWLAFRVCVFTAAIMLFIVDPSQLDISQNVGFAHGFTFIDFLFLVLISDLLTKFFPNARIAMGSLKQFGELHVPTTPMFENGREGFIQYIRDVIQQGRVAIEKVPAQLRQAWVETRNGAITSLKVLIRRIDVLRLLPFNKEHLKANETMREIIRRDRLHEILPVGIFWIVFNAAIAATLWLLGWLTQPVIMLWVLFYFVCDLVFVVLWCPLQLVFMKNRCCTTCQIFNWDGIMAVTPLFLLVGDLSAAWFTWPLLALAVIVFFRWELAFARHPERFDERTNASLQCANCSDKLCYIRTPLTRKLPYGENTLSVLVGSLEESIEKAAHSTVQNVANAKNSAVEKVASATNSAVEKIANVKQSAVEKVEQARSSRLADDKSHAESLL